MIAFISCILCWIIGLIMGSDVKLIDRLLDELIRERLKKKAKGGEETA